MSELLFSYGTLQLAHVQRQLFGRTLEGVADTLHGFAMTWIDIRDGDAVAASGVTRHRALVPDADAPPVDGVLYEVSEAELAAADVYEGADYRRVEVRFASGRTGWVYVKA